MGGDSADELCLHVYDLTIHTIVMDDLVIAAARGAG
jgi:hypothetical protein